MVSSAPAAGGLANEVAAAVDAAAGGRVIVLGSLPPEGRDLDLVARRPERERLERALADAGLVFNGISHALFRDCSAYGVELFAGESFLPPAALEQLFAQALPIEGFESLARPAPAHSLLVQARIVRREGQLSAKRRARIEQLLDEDPGAWDAARQAAPSWDAERALAELRKSFETGRALSAGTRAEVRARRALRGARRRGVLVALSGIDGAGKSSQARWLAEALSEIGVEVEVAWNSMMGSGLQNLIAKAGRSVLRRTGRGEGRIGRWEESPADGGEQSMSPIRLAWSMFVTVANALEQRRNAVRGALRGRVTVFDRSPLDLAVRVQVLYGTAVGPQRRLIELLTPRPTLAFLLDIPAEVSLARKQDIWAPSQLSDHSGLYRALAPRFGARRLDGQRPPDEIAAEIGAAVWLAIGRRSRW